MSAAPGPGRGRRAARALGHLGPRAPSAGAARV